MDEVGRILPKPPQTSGGVRPTIGRSQGPIARPGPGVPGMSRLHNQPLPLAHADANSFFLSAFGVSYAAAFSRSTITGTASPLATEESAASDRGATKALGATAALDESAAISRGVLQELAMVRGLSESQARDKAPPGSRASPRALSETADRASAVRFNLAFTVGLDRVADSLRGQLTGTVQIARGTSEAADRSSGRDMALAETFGKERSAAWDKTSKVSLARPQVLERSLAESVAHQTMIAGGHGESIVPADDVARSRLLASTIAKEFSVAEDGGAERSLPLAVGKSQVVAWDKIKPINTGYLRGLSEAVDRATGRMTVMAKPSGQSSAFSADTRAGGFIPGKCVVFVAANDQYFQIASNSTLQVPNVDAWWAFWAWLDDKAGNVWAITKSNVNNNGEYSIVYDKAFADRWKNSLENGGTFREVLANNFGSAPTNTWHFVFCWYDSVNGTQGISINGGAANTQSMFGTTIAATAQPFTVGAIQGGAQPFNGRFDSMAFGKSPPGGIAAIVSTINSTLYNSGAGLGYDQLTAQQKSDWGLVSWWKMNEPSGTRFDSHGTNNLSAVNNPLSTTGYVADGGAFPSILAMPRVLERSAAYDRAKEQVNVAAMHGSSFTVIVDRLFKPQLSISATAVVKIGPAAECRVAIGPAATAETMISAGGQHRARIN